ncbi:zinc-binding dehydrogenase [Oceanicola sp. D3]|uniref:zinc-binding dehydrogenase n=1 Tax=Oceanicola sp. D3 TaxID=2587163 RepID=UPI00112199DF|nr:zinc-binding dehydrogenase [Oceanicola sp. D3]QDC10515.1 zinc-binding dehydrogenase [Oceanicola sp. D3]
MKAITYDTFGEPADVLQTSDVAVPEPKAGEVRIDMTLSPIHNHDLWTARGTYGYKPELPAVGGTEALGTIEAVGEGVDEALLGKRVVAAGVHGAWAEQFIAPAAAVVPLPEEIGDEAGAQLIAMPFSALALLEYLEVNEGDWVVQTAANGTVGKIFAELAKARGVKTLNLVRRAEAIDELTELGIENVLNTSDEGWVDEARKILGNEGAQAAIDSVGGAIVADIADLLGTDGTLVVFGTATGDPLQLRAGPVISRHLQVKGFWGSRVIGEMDGAEKGRLIGELVSLAAKGQLHLPSGGEFPLDQPVEAVKASLTPGRSGKILLRG